MACRNQTLTASTVSVVILDSRAPVELAPPVLPPVCLKQTLVLEVWVMELSPERPIPPLLVSPVRDNGLLTPILTTLIIGEVGKKFFFSILYISE